MMILRQQLCSVTGMSNSEVKKVQKMLAATPIVPTIGVAMTITEKQKFLTQLISWCTTDRQNFLVGLEHWPTASKKEIRTFSKVITELGTGQPIGCGSAMTQRPKSSSDASQDRVARLIIQRPSRPGSKALQVQSAPKAEPSRAVVVT
ncbi:hypothetical protein FRB94_008003 [Tulasnella sp. JGI-2019a]|nr:hypothetical protein FRB94_008003 [Tulasnella sp. JGI-2019a]KAG9027429.1 hypothetical protein FRB95_007764 [Tulasnella sp. JGI-2019a]